MFSRKEQRSFIEAALGGTLLPCPGCNNATEHEFRRYERATWCNGYAKFQAYWVSGYPNFSIFVEGNKKLPFFAFSALPDYTCPGAGACLKYCYSFKAWRGSAAFFRQVQNTLLLKSAAGRDHIAKAWRALPYGVPVRLYVDGDIDSSETLTFWIGLCGARPDLGAYGYSKSWEIFLAFDATGVEWPSNYFVNLSSGSRYGVRAKERMAALPISRGEFVTLPTAHKAPDRRLDRAAWAVYVKSIKATARAYGYARSFVCPGKCGDCLPQGEHACGSNKFKGIPIVIGAD